MKTIKIFAAVVMALVFAGCMSLRGMYEYNGTPYEAHNGDVELRVMNDPTENQIKDIYRQMEDSGYVEIGRGERISDDRPSSSACITIAKEQNAAAILYYSQYLSQNIVGMYRVTPTYSMPVYGESRRHVIVLFGKQKTNDFGISLGPLTDQDMRKADTREGAKVLFVKKNSEAWNRCFFAGDIIIKIDEQLIRNHEEAESFLKNTSAASFIIIRDGRKLEK